MRRILSQEEIGVREQRRTKIFGIFILALMVLSSVGFAFIYRTSDDTVASETISNSNEKAVQDSNGLWNIQLGDQVLAFVNSPSSVRRIFVNTSSNISLSGYYGKPLYIATENPLLYTEIESTLGRYTERVQQACYLKCDNPDLPEKDCTSNLIVIGQNKESYVYSEQNCVFIPADMPSVDAFLYSMFGVNL